ncbi:oxidoreductase [candidate division MSBL1 archaeon SCGC-AAA259A05]|uniref:Oxidoreductase n=1 Tax=candidate division MSBL1 archaeon SCGC-AAA259A05 TaxID=1698259 RepID=A0A133UA62_9EURY|nr:oxidoreductase [candidate division MSBL1 archaeon SCGC-AAA259A05]
MSDEVRIGVVGAGSISLRGILPHLTQGDVQDRVRVVAICDPKPGRADRAARKFDVPDAFEDYDDLLDSGEVDAVTIASPIGVHFVQGRKAIEHGLHVHFNKTMATTLEEANELIDLAEEEGVKLVPSPGEMIHPVNQEIRALVEEGALGKITWAVTGAAFGRYHEEESVRQGDDVLTNINPAWYFRRPGGGPLYDMTVYGLHTLTGILGPAMRVKAFSGLRIPKREFRGETVSCEMDDNTLILLDFSDQIFAFVYGVPAGSLPNQGHSRHPMIFGTEGVVKRDTLNGEPVDREVRELIEDRGWMKGWSAALPHVNGPHRSIEEAHVYEDIMQLVDWIREGNPTLASAEHARHVIEIIYKAYRSAQTGETEKLDTDFEPLKV